MSDTYYVSNEHRTQTTLALVLAASAARRRRNTARTIVPAVLAILSVLVVMCASGCGVGQTARGEPVVGFRIGPPDPATTATLSAATSLMTGADPIVAAIVGITSILLGGGIVGWRMERVARQREHQAWDEATQVAAGKRP